MYRVDWSNQVLKDAEKIERAGLKSKVADIAGTIERNPYEPTQNFEKLHGDLKNMYSRRVDYHNRFVYSVFPNTERLKDANGELYDGIVRVHQIWGHY